LDGSQPLRESSWFTRAGRYRSWLPLLRFNYSPRIGNWSESSQPCLLFPPALWMLLKMLLLRVYMPTRPTSLKRCPRRHSGKQLGKKIEHIRSWGPSESICQPYTGKVIEPLGGYEKKYWGLPTITASLTGRGKYWRLECWPNRQMGLFIRLTGLLEASIFSWRNSQFQNPNHTLRWRTLDYVSNCLWRLYPTSAGIMLLSCLTS
jgi:hypothetical protein